MPKKPKRIHNVFSEETLMSLRSINVHSEDELHKAAHLGWYDDFPSDVRREILNYVELLERRKDVEKAKKAQADAGRRFHKSRKKVEERMQVEVIHPVERKTKPAPDVPPGPEGNRVIVRRKYYPPEALTKSGKIRSNRSAEIKKKDAALAAAQALLAKVQNEQGGQND